MKIALTSAFYTNGNLTVEQILTMTDLTPRNRIETDRFIIGQNDAKTSDGVALRNRWRASSWRDLRGEVLPQDIPDDRAPPRGRVKPKSSRGWQKLARRTFLKVEATKIHRIGYVRARCRTD